ncbi:protein of unknown function [Methylacidimicrobium sp. AP8]|nr:protein of unknown function [Methylacidimicrobium sp. AP8]
MMPPAVGFSFASFPLDRGRIRNAMVRLSVRRRGGKRSPCYIFVTKRYDRSGKERSGC